MSSVAWGDADNDGDLDILLTGRGNTLTPIAQVYRNNGDSTFTDINAGLTGVRYSSVAWGDADNDGDLDVLLTGRDSTGTRIAKVYRNNAVTANTPPSTPTGLTEVSSSPTSLTFGWAASTDTQTPANGLSYNLRVGTTPGGSDVFSTMASSASGTRHLPDAGPIQGTSFTLQGLKTGVNYYWSVQAIDTAFAGGPFAAEQSADINDTPPTIGGVLANQPVNDNATIGPFATLTVTDPDNQNLFAKVTILNGVVRGDFTAASTVGWTRTVTGNNILYSRYYTAAVNNGANVQAAIRAFVFQPRNNVLPIGQTEVTAFSVYVTDGTANVTNSTTSVITTSVATGHVLTALILDSDITTVVVPSVSKPRTNTLARLLKNSR